MDDERMEAPAENAAPSIPDLSALLTDPAMLARITSVISTLQAPAAEPSATPSPASQQASVPTDGLSALLSNPAILEKLPQMMALLAPMLRNTGAPAPAADATPAAKLLPPSPTADRDNLLLAIKPFLSSGRRDAVDTILRIEHLGALLRPKQ
jgi:hypothetical protein